MAELSSALVYPFAPEGASHCVWLPAAVNTRGGVQDIREVFCYPEGSAVAFLQGTELASQPLGALASNWTGRRVGMPGGISQAATSGVPVPADLARTLMPGLGNLTEGQRRLLIAAIVAALVVIGLVAVTKSPAGKGARRAVRVYRRVRA